MKALEELMQDPFVLSCYLRIDCLENGSFRGEIFADSRLVFKTNINSTLDAVMRELESFAKEKISEET